MVKPGKVTLNGKKIKVVPAKKAGWFTFTFKTFTYYIRITKTGFKTFRVSKKGKKVPGKGVGGKWIFIV